MNQHNALSIGLVVVLLIGGFVFWLSRDRSRSRGLSRQDVIEEMQDRAGQAVDEARSRYSATLDYSPASIERVEEILSLLHKEHQARPLSQQQLTRAMLKWGGYVGEVIKTMRKGEWALDSAAAGEATFPIIFEDQEGGQTFPVVWCNKRIQNGPEDNVWNKFQILFMNAGTSVLTATPDGNIIAPEESKPN